MSITLSLANPVTFTIPESFEHKPMGRVAFRFIPPRRVGTFTIGFAPANDIRSDSPIFAELVKDGRLADAQIASFLFHTPGILPRELEVEDRFIRFPGSDINDDGLPTWINLFWAGSRWSFDLLPIDFPLLGDNLVAVIEDSR